MLKRRTPQPCPETKDTSTPVRLFDIHKAFDTKVVLDGISLDVQKGKTTVVLGPSGAGKSVILRHIVGLIKPDAGSVELLGCCIDRMSPSELRFMRSRVGFLFQLSALFDSMTIGENLEFPLTEGTNTPKAQRHRRVKDALALVDLSGVEHQMPAELSGGQRKRAALARAIMLQPEVMLYDEPTTGLDPIRSAEIDNLINKAREELGVTSIVVTHDLASARHVADRVVLLSGGKICADGTMADLEQSTDPRVRAFLTGGGARDNSNKRLEDFAAPPTPPEPQHADPRNAEQPTEPHA
jgi:phospholipid/cholesterol/gamma-HCH transport system ATP-binding protein